MPIRNAVSMTFRPRSVSDTVDGTNVSEGAMAALTNLAPSAGMAGAFSPRSPATKIDHADLSADADTAGITVHQVVGNLVYGMYASKTTYAGKDAPFVFDLNAGAFLTVQGVSSAWLPTTNLTTGDITQPSMALVGSRMVVCHPGFPGTNVLMGCFDFSSFNDAGVTGTTHTASVTVDTFSANVLLRGWQIGMKISGGNLPADTRIVSIATSGASITVSAPPTGVGVAGAALTVSGGTPASPLWCPGNLGNSALTKVPVWVYQFNGRAWYASDSGVLASDVSFPFYQTDPSHVITFANKLNVTCMSGIGMATPVIGGVVHTMVVFQSVYNIVIVNGDFTTNDMFVQSTDIPTGTLSPRSVCPVTHGLAFISPDGLRVLDFNMNVSDPIGHSGTGVVVPFLNSSTPSRTAASFGEDTIRISCFNGDISGSPAQEYWFDVRRKVWTGPHTFPCQGYSFASPLSPGFVMVPNAANAFLWQGTTIPSPDVPDPNQSFVENGTELFWLSKTALFPDNARSAMNLIVEATIDLALQPLQSATLTVEDDSGNVLETVVISSPSSVQTIWGQFKWGQAKWSKFGTTYKQYRIAPKKPMVFKQARFSVSGLSKRNTEVGNIYIKYSPLGYVI